MQLTHQRHQAANLLMGVIYDFTCKDKQQAASAAWQQWVAEQLNAELAGNLFSAAATRGNAAAVKALDAIKPAAVPETVFGNTLADAVEQEQSALLQVLCKHSSMRTATPSVRQLVVPLLLASLEDDDTEGVVHLLLTNTMVQKRLQPSHTFKLMLAALEADHEQCVRLLLQLPGVQRLQPMHFITLMRHFVSDEPAFINQPQHHLLPVIVKHVPAAALAAPPMALPAAYWPTAYNLIALALQRQDSSAVQLYVEWVPVTAAIPPDRMVSLMKDTLPKCPAAFCTLSSLPGAQQLSSGNIEELLVRIGEAPFNSEMAACVQVLCGLPQASHMQCSTIRDLLLRLLSRQPRLQCATCWSKVSRICLVRSSSSSSSRRLA
jgi:hypothetical protein